MHVLNSVIGMCFFNAAGLVMRLRNPPSSGKEQEPATAGFGHDKFIIDLKDLEIGRELGKGQYGVSASNKF